jgi:hypothetical protein
MAMICSAACYILVPDDIARRFDVEDKDRD